MVTPARFERATYRLGIWRSILLSYGAISVTWARLRPVCILFKVMVTPSGFEPLTYRLGIWRSIQLSYGAVTISIFRLFHFCRRSATLFENAAPSIQLARSEPPGAAGGR